MHDDVGAKLDRITNSWRRDSVIHNHRNTVAVSCGTDRLEIDDIARRVTYGFAVDRFGVFVDKFLDRLGRIVLSEAYFDTLTGQHMCEKRVSTAVQLWCRNDVIPRLS